MSQGPVIFNKPQEPMSADKPREPLTTNKPQEPIQEPSGARLCAKLILAHGNLSSAKEEHRQLRELIWAGLIMLVGVSDTAKTTALNGTCF